jgi:amidase
MRTVLAVLLAAVVHTFALGSEDHLARSETFELATATIADINAAIDAGVLTSEKLVQLYLNRIAAYDQQGPRINSIITVNQKALTTARTLDQERKTTGRRSPLHGIPIIAKDLLNTADMQTTGGFIGLKDAVPQADAHVIARLRRAGAIILAKANMTDWLGRAESGGGSSIAGPVLNPYNLNRRTAGSSSGTSAAMAAWFGSAGIGSETGTSIRNPTTDGALVGLAPSEGLIGRSGAMAYTFTHERVGPMCRNTYDVAVMLDYMVGLDVNDLTTAQSLTRLPNASYTTFLHPSGLRGARIGVFREMFRRGPAHEEGLALAEAAIFALHKAGASVLDPVSIGMNLDRLRTLKVNYWEAETILDKYLADFGPTAPFSTIREMVKKFPNQVSPSLLEYLEGSPGPDAEYQSRLKGRRALREAVIALMDKHELDALVFPHKTFTARGSETQADPLNAVVRAGDRVTESDNYLSPMTGLPALLVPMGYTKEGLSLALEFLGRPFSEPVLLKLASGFEAQTKHRKAPSQVPPLPGEKFTY